MATPQFPVPNAQPPPYQEQRTPPPSGFRIPLNTDAQLPPPQQLGPPVSYDADGRSPIFLGSAIFPNAVHPCKIGPHLSPPCRVPYGGGEHEHHGRYDLLPFDPTTMEWVHTSQGRVPPGRRPVEGGYEQGGGKLYHALAVIDGIRVPGKAGEHLGGANIAFGGGEHAVHDNYEILCWR
ncbi:hypothetical protein C8Q72DRAFT_460923 [Fomitopsis betulina]|nr:hypothetical protein C8Q72DRAFT_460923 [Fomitopsis betulina]